MTLSTEYSVPKNSSQDEKKGLRTELKKSQKRLNEQIDWDYINVLKQDPEEFHDFIQEGKQVVQLVSTLREIK